MKKEKNVNDKWIKCSERLPEPPDEEKFERQFNFKNGNKIKLRVDENVPEGEAWLVTQIENVRFAEIITSEEIDE